MVTHLLCVIWCGHLTCWSWRQEWNQPSQQVWLILILCRNMGKCQRHLTLGLVWGSVKRRSCSVCVCFVRSARHRHVKQSYFFIFFISIHPHGNVIQLIGNDRTSYLEICQLLSIHLKMPISNLKFIYLFFFYSIIDSIGSWLRHRHAQGRSFIIVTRVSMTTTNPFI